MQRRGKRSGLTLIEMLLTIGIMGMLLSLSVGVTREGNRQIELFQERSFFVGNLNKAKSYALQTHRREGGGGTNSCGFGVVIDRVRNEYALFEDIDPNPNSLDCGSANRRYQNGEWILESGTALIYALPPSIRFADPSAGTVLEEVLYVPPDPDVYINRDTVVSEARIRLVTVTGAAGVDIIVNSAGNISTR